MNDDRHLIIHFTNGAKMEVMFPIQVKDAGAGLLEAFKRIMAGDKLAIQTEDRLLIIPWSSVQHAELSPAPAATPFGTIQKARVIE